MPEFLLTFWILVIFVFLITEFIKVTGDFFPFVVGGIGACICYALNLGLPIQVAVFAALAVLCWFTLRPTFKKKQRARVESDVIDPDEHVGEKVMVTGKIDDRGWGRVAIDNKEYRARAENPAEKYNVADYVTIVGVEGQWIIVKR